MKVSTAIEKLQEIYNKYGDEYELVDCYDSISGDWYTTPYTEFKINPNDREIYILNKFYNQE